MIFKLSFRAAGLALEAVLFLGLCGFADESRTSLTAVQTAGAASVKEIIFIKELTIGVVSGDENYMFGKSVSFSVDDLGNIYILDWDKKQIKKFGPDGKFQLTIGRQGQGPGEFQNPSVARFTRDGKLYVSENFGNRIYFFDAGGKFIDQTTLTDRITDIWIGPTGIRLGTRQKIPQYVGQGPTEATTTIFDDQYRPILELHKDVIDLLPSRNDSRAQMFADISTYFLAHPNPVAVMGEDGRIYFGCNNVYAIDIYSPQGKKLRTIARNVPPVEYGRKDIDFILKMYEESMYADQPESVRKEILELIKFPKYKPAFLGIVSMEKGLMATIVDMTAYDECHLDIFDVEGLFRGRVRAKIPWRGLTFKNGKAYSVRTDEAGYFFIERYAYEIR